MLDKTNNPISICMILFFILVSAWWISISYHLHLMISNHSTLINYFALYSMIIIIILPKPTTSPRHFYILKNTYIFYHPTMLYPKIMLHLQATRKPDPTLCTVQSPGAFPSPIRHKSQASSSWLCSLSIIRTPFPHGEPSSSVRSRAAVCEEVPARRSFVSVKLGANVKSQYKRRFPVLFFPS